MLTACLARAAPLQVAAIMPTLQHFLVLNLHLTSTYALGRKHPTHLFGSLFKTVNVILCDCHTMLVFHSECLFPA